MKNPFETAKNWVESRFKSLLMDAMQFAHFANQKGQLPQLHAAFARTSIIHSVFALECAANACVRNLSVNKEFKQRAERMDTLSKLDLFLLSRGGGKKIPRQDIVVLKVIELIQIRNNYVHPKSRTLPVSVGLANDGTHGLRVEVEGSEHLDIPNMIKLWDGTHAVAAIKAVCDFLYLFFRDLCGFDCASISGFLFTTFESEDDIRAADARGPEDLREAACFLGISLALLESDLNTPASAKANVTVERKPRSQ